MNNPLDKFEKLANSFNDLSYEPSNQSEIDKKHPFDMRDIHHKFSQKVKKLFDSKDYAEATFHACKIIDNRVKKLSGVSSVDETGHSLMMNAFNELSPKIYLCDHKNNKNQHKSIQRGYRYIFAGFCSAIRNPPAHDDSENIETRDECLEHLIFASFLMRKLDKAEELRVSHPTK